MSRGRLAARGAALLMGILASAPAGAEGPGEVILLPSGASLTRLTPPSQDAVRPRLSPDGRSVAYVSRRVRTGRSEPVSLEDLREGAAARPASGGDEIWVVPLSGESPRRRVAAPPESGLDPGRGGYSLHDLSWSPEGDRLGFTWYDGAGWARLYVSDPGHPLVPLPVPQEEDPWEPGASFSLSATQMTWSPEGKGRFGYFVAWDEQCGSIYRVRVPAPGEEAGDPAQKVPGPGGCLALLLEAPGHWLYRTREEDMSQRVGILNVRGSVIESRSFGIEAPVLARWGVQGKAAWPPAALWWREIGRDHVVMSIWTRDGLEEWGHFQCRGACPEPVLVTNKGLWFLDGPGTGRRLMLLASAGGTPAEIVPAGVTALRSSSDGSVLVVVMTGKEDAGSSLWRLNLRD